MSFISKIKEQGIRINELEREREIFREDLRVLLNRERKLTQALKKITNYKLNPVEARYIALKALGVKGE